MFRWIRGKMGKMGKIVYRLAHNGEVSAYPAPDMSKVIWSPAQDLLVYRRGRRRELVCGLSVMEWITGSAAIPER